MNTLIHAADRNNKTVAVTTRACPTSEPQFVVYQGTIAAQAIAHFFDQQDAQLYARWRNHNSQTEKK